MSDRQIPRRHTPCACGSGLDRYAVHHPLTGRFAFYCCALCGVAVRAHAFPPVYTRPPQPQISDRLKQFLKRC